MTQAFAGLQLQSTVSSEGVLTLDLAKGNWADPAAGEIIVRIEASPLNPSDLANVFGPADLSTLESGKTDAGPVLTARIPAGAMGGLAARIGQPLVGGNEGAGTVVVAGSGAEHLLGKLVGTFGGRMYAQYRKLPVADCIPLPEGATAQQGAAMFINPLTALCFVETMKAEGHSAIVHFAAASSLGQMLNRICLKDGVPLVNVVRSAEQVALLRSAGAEHVLNSSDPDFISQLIDAVEATGATLAFDPIGGGRQAAQVLDAMEKAALRKMTSYDRYGSGKFKQVYIYGMLDSAPVVIDGWFGYAWSVGGWLFSYSLARLGADGAARLKQRIADELTTTFANSYIDELTFETMLQPDNVRAFMRRSTGGKYLLRPQG
ncbi:MULTISPECIES: zinc-binding dehydrogenase [unclassified Sphingobium]|uniref:zinc-binding dehydrogenase n=1 Tax=unclassified Sphingobium TaxID=2611147 RepID=UPI0007705BB7|nr:MULTISPECIES: zinc-binding dehydrogenase [unclassified Sphingobium]AMK21121.1 alcohol dehydrogenase [Sphingobium sp. TKS]NML89706.1 zinc-binding dehydrogenase [Sphingobium sp. TB-6]